MYIYIYICGTTPKIESNKFDLFLLSPLYNIYIYVCVVPPSTYLFYQSTFFTVCCADFAIAGHCSVS